MSLQKATPLLASDSMKVEKAINIIDDAEAWDEYRRLVSDLNVARNLCRSALTYMQDPSSINFDALECGLEMFLEQV